MTDRLLNARDVAERLQVPESWVREQARRGRIPSLKLGHYTRFRLEALEQWIKDQEERTAA